MKWTDVRLLSDYMHALTGPGIYIIGSARELDQPVLGLPALLPDDHSGENWPANFQPEYVGNSLDENLGMRGRLESHFNKKGNQYVADLIGFGSTLYFIQSAGIESAEYEALFILLRNPPYDMSGNTRDECVRSSNRQYKKVRAAMTDQERDHYDALEPGEGM